MLPQNRKTIIIAFFLIFFSEIIYSQPWFTGPILAGSGHTVARGHTNFEIYLFDGFTDGQYNNSQHLIAVPLFKSTVFNALLSYGLNDWLDLQLSLPYSINSTQGVNYHHLGDTAVGIGLQVLEQKKHEGFPDLRLFIQETLPSGNFQRLNVGFLGTDSTGLGSYRTMLSLNLQYLNELFNSHYLRTRVIFSRLFSSPVHVTGLNSYGGTSDTCGTIRRGIRDNFDLAFEFSVTQNWVAVMEGYISWGQSTQFDGILDRVNSGTALTIGERYSEQGLAPALEYNFTEHVGIIGGVWFPIKGKNTSHFLTYVLALNAYW